MQVRFTGAAAHHEPDFRRGRRHAEHVVPFGFGRVGDAGVVEAVAHDHRRVVAGDHRPGRDGGVAHRLDCPVEVEVRRDIREARDRGVRRIVAGDGGRFAARADRGDTVEQPVARLDGGVVVPGDVRSVAQERLRLEIGRAREERRGDVALDGRRRTDVRPEGTDAVGIVDRRRGCVREGGDSRAECRDQRVGRTIDAGLADLDDVARFVVGVVNPREVHEVHGLRRRRHAGRREREQRVLGGLVAVGRRTHRVERTHAVVVDLVEREPGVDERRRVGRQHRDLDEARAARARAAFDAVAGLVVRVVGPVERDAGGRDHDRGQVVDHGGEQGRRRRRVGEGRGADGVVRPDTEGVAVADHEVRREVSGDVRADAVDHREGGASRTGAALDEEAPLIEAVVGPVERDLRFGLRRRAEQGRGGRDEQRRPGRVGEARRAGGVRCPHSIAVERAGHGGRVGEDRHARDGRVDRDEGAAPRARAALDHEALLVVGDVGPGEIHPGRRRDRRRERDRRCREERRAHRRHRAARRAGRVACHHAVVVPVAQRDREVAVGGDVGGHRVERRDDVVAGGGVAPLHDEPQLVARVVGPREVDPRGGDGRCRERRRIGRDRRGRGRHGGVTRGARDVGRPYAVAVRRVRCQTLVRVGRGAGRERGDLGEQGAARAHATLHAVRGLVAGVVGPAQVDLRRRQGRRDERGRIGRHERVGVGDRGVTRDAGVVRAADAIAV